MNLKKLIQNNLVAITFVLPNIAINLSVQAFLDIYMGWTGWLSILAWMIGGGLSLEFGVLLSMFIKSNFQLGRWKWSYSDEK